MDGVHFTFQAPNHNKIIVDSLHFVYWNLNLWHYESIF